MGANLTAALALAEALDVAPLARVVLLREIAGLVVGKLNEPMRSADA